MVIQARRVDDGELVKIEGVKEMSRIRTDLQRASKRAGWLLKDQNGLSYLYDDLLKIVYIGEE